MPKQLCALEERGKAACARWVRRWLPGFRTALAAAVMVALAAMLVGVMPAGDAWAQAQNNIRQTKHNLSKNAPAGNTVKSTNVDQVCVFCHTPHAASKDATTGDPIKPLWNRKLSSASYNTYGSLSLDALAAGQNSLPQPGGSSKLCLSCHDGTVAIGQINVLNGVANPTVTMNGTQGNAMPTGNGANTGFTRRLGTDLTNDHPISFTYNDTNANSDGDLQKPSTAGNLLANRGSGVHPTLPLENGQMQCTTCHDPHLYDPQDPNRKFLRLNRLQKTAAPTSTFNASNDIICLACHTKEGYPGSAHADMSVASPVYTDAEAAARGFPTGTAVWQASCLNCHDPHTVQGSRRLLREGTDGANDGTGHHNGGNSAIEEACYACHSKDGNSLGTLTLKNQGTAGFAVPDVKTDFKSADHMPIALATETHDVGGVTSITSGTTTTAIPHAGKDGVESPSKLGGTNRHAECPDCHNPHRVKKVKTFSDTTTGASGTHVHDQSGNTAHSNTISGALRGTVGVEPVYTSTSFGTNPTGFTVKFGDPGSAVANDTGQPYVTKEYQICLKCHSNYAYGATPPALGWTGGLTTQFFTHAETTGAGTSPACCGPTTYTNQAMEFQAPSGDAVEAGGNHRSWHPVMAPTGRTPSLRGSSSMNTNWLGPFSKAVGTQTMYCSDCHGSNVSTAVTASTGTVVPDNNTTNENGNPWGPHGSSNAFILKAPWSDLTGASQGTTNPANPTPNSDLCFHCHKWDQYANRTGTQGSSGFGGSKGSNLHIFHADKIRGNNSNNEAAFKCTLCHVGIVHGWKNKAFLANLNAVGPEGGLGGTYNVTMPTGSTSKRYYRAPYYMGAILRVMTWSKSGTWSDTDCGPSGNTGRNWMKATCVNLP